jgi:hypothetical protein
VSFDDCIDLALPPYAVDPETERHEYATEAQAAFHGLPAIYKMFRGGLGSGKSHAGAREFMSAVLENAEHRGRLRNPGKTGLLYLVAAPTYDVIEVGAWHHITQWLDEFETINGFALDRKRRISDPRKIELITGDTIKFLSMEKYEKWAAATAAGVWFDESELCDDPIGAFKMLQGRLRDRRSYKRFIIVTSSPRGNRGLARMFKEKQAAGDERFRWVKASSYDNPGNAEGYVDDMASTMSERERRQQIEGEIVADEGAVYGLEFDDSYSIAHDWRWTGRPRFGECYYDICTDWGGSYHGMLIEHHPHLLYDHMGNPMPDSETREGWGTDIVIDEFLADGVQDREYCRQVAARCREKWGIQPKDINLFYCDYNPRDAEMEARRWWSPKVRSWRVEDKNDRIERINTLRWRLCGGDRIRRLMFAPHLRQTRHDRRILDCMLNYRYKELKIDGQTVLSELPTKDGPWPHGPDALGYRAWIKYSQLRWHEKRAA